MAFLPALIGGGSSVLGGMIANKGQQQAAQQAADAQKQLTQQTISQMEGYDQQQQGAQRNAIAGLIGGGNPFYSAAAGLKPAFLAPGSDTANFGGSGNAPGTFSMPNPFSSGAPGGAPGAPGGIRTMPIAQRLPPASPAPPPLAGNPFTNLRMPMPVASSPRAM